MCLLHRIQITDTLNATYCSSYDEKRKIETTGKKIKCIDCKKINPNTYCAAKKRCFNIKEQNKERNCIKSIHK